MPSTTKVYVGNLPDNCKDESVRDLFFPYGEVSELVIIKNYAFVHFVEEEHATNAVRDLNGAKLLGKEINVEISKPKSENKDRSSSSSSTSSSVRRPPPRNSINRRSFSPYRNNNQDRNQDNRNHNHHQDHRNNNNNINQAGSRRENNNNQLPNLPSNLGAGLLGNIITPPVLGNLGILSAVNTLAAVAEKQKQFAQQQGLVGALTQQQRNTKPLPNITNGHDTMTTMMDGNNLRQNQHQQGRTTSRDPNEGSSVVENNNNSGYVIYERYYVDPNHALLKGLPLPELPRAKDSHVGYPPPPPIQDVGNFNNGRWNRQDRIANY